MYQSMKLFFIAVILTNVSSKLQAQDHVLIEKNFRIARERLNNTLKVLNAKDLRYPRSLDSNGNLTTTDMQGWTSGFFEGSLWYASEFLQDSMLQRAAETWTNTLEPLKDFRNHHDLGFMLYNSYGHAYRLTGNKKYADILVAAAKSLCTRFNPVVGSIKSWERFLSWHDRSKIYYYPVIIDNMMNLELLFFASKYTGDPYFKNIAIKHAETTLKNHVRENFTTYHVVCYDSTTGKVLTRETGQGWADASAWARGQAWGLYGFTMTYRETKDERFLKTAIGMADWFIKNNYLPRDYIPYWDFNAGMGEYGPGAFSQAEKLNRKQRDVSAAAITASALFQLSEFKTRHSKRYRKVAVKILESLSKPSYQVAESPNSFFILDHSVGSIPNGTEIDVPLIYADYYFLEALKLWNDTAMKTKRK